jgi:hypothetical protein
MTSKHLIARSPAAAWTHIVIVVDRAARAIDIAVYHARPERSAVSSTMRSMAVSDDRTEAWDPVAEFPSYNAACYFWPQNTMSQGGNTGELCGMFWVDCRQMLGKIAP